jgi:hypothetical protein
VIQEEANSRIVEMITRSSATKIFHETPSNSGEVCRIQVKYLPESRNDNSDMGIIYPVDI